MIVLLIDEIRERTGESKYQLVADFMYEQKFLYNESVDHKEIKRRYKERHEKIRNILKQRLEKTKPAFGFLSKIFWEYACSNCPNYPSSEGPSCAKCSKYDTDSSNKFAFDEFLSKTNGQLPIPPEYKKILLDEFDKA